MALKQLQKLVASGSLSCELADHGTEVAVMNKKMLQSSGSASSKLAGSALAPILDSGEYTVTSVSPLKTVSTAPITVAQTSPVTSPFIEFAESSMHSQKSVTRTTSLASTTSTTVTVETTEQQTWVDDATPVHSLVSPIQSPLTPRDVELDERQAELQRRRQQLIELRQLADRKKIEKSSSDGPSRIYSITETHRVPSLTLSFNSSPSSPGTGSPVSPATVRSSEVQLPAAISIYPSSPSPRHGAQSSSSKKLSPRVSTPSNTLPKLPAPKIFAIEIHKLAPDITLTEYTGPFIASIDLKKRVCFQK